MPVAAATVAIRAAMAPSTNIFIVFFLVGRRSNLTEVTPSGGEGRPPGAPWDAHRNRLLNLGMNISEPHAQSRHQSGLLGVLSGFLRQITGFTELAGPLDAQIGGELAGDFVAQAQTGGDFREAATDALRFVAPTIQVGFDVWLQDQLLGEQQLVLGVEPCRRPPALAHVGSRVDLEPVRRQALDAEGEPAAIRIDAAVLSHAQLGVPVAGDRMAPQQLGASLLQTPVVCLAFRLEHQAVVVAPVPCLHVVVDAVAVTAPNGLQPVDEERPEAVLVRQARARNRAEVGTLRIGVRIARVGGGLAPLHRTVFHLPHGAVIHRVSVGTRSFRGRDRQARRRQYHHACPQPVLHSDSSARHDTTTSRNMPASMWNIRWQCQAHRPGASAVTRKLTRWAGWTAMVCLRTRKRPSGVSSSLHMPCMCMGWVIMVSLWR